MDSDHPYIDAETVSADPDLAYLIAVRKGDRSYQRIAEDSGGAITRNRVQQLATEPRQKQFPSPETIRGLARALGATETEVVAAAARSVGIDVRYGIDPRALVIGRAGELPARARDAIVAIAHELLTAYDRDGSKEVGRDGHAAPIGEVTDQHRPSRTSTTPQPGRGGDGDDTGHEPTSGQVRSDGRLPLLRGRAHGSTRRSSGKQPPRGK